MHVFCKIRFFEATTTPGGSLMLLTISFRVFLHHVTNSPSNIRIFVYCFWLALIRHNVSLSETWCNKCNMFIPCKSKNICAFPIIFYAVQLTNAEMVTDYFFYYFLLLFGLLIKHFTNLSISISIVKPVWLVIVWHQLCDSEAIVWNFCSYDSNTCLAVMFEPVVMIIMSSTFEILGYRFITKTSSTPVLAFLKSKASIRKKNKCNHGKKENEKNSCQV